MNARKYPGNPRGECAPVDDERTVEVDIAALTNRFPSWLPAQVEAPPPSSWGPPSGAPESPRQLPFTVAPELAPSSAAGASDAAARIAPHVPPRSSRPPTSGVRSCPMQIVWFDPASLPAVRQQPSWRFLLAELELGRLGLEDANAGEDPSRRDVRDVLTIGTPETPAELREGVATAMNQPEFEPPLVVVEGELELVFDEVETLKATMMVVTPLAGNDKALLGPLEAAAAFLQAAVFQHSGDIAGRLTAAISRAFQAERRTLTLEQLEAIVTRTLVEQRSYQKRGLYGSTWIRALFVSEGSRERIPCYVPSELGPKLPMFSRFRVKLIAAVDTRQDPQEECSIALRSVALARMLTLPR